MTDTLDWLLNGDDTKFRESLSLKSFEDLRDTLERAIASLSNDAIPFDSIAQIVRRSRQILDECNARILRTQDALSTITNERSRPPVAPPDEGDSEAF